MTTFGRIEKDSRERYGKSSVHDIRETPLGWHHEEKGKVGGLPMSKQGQVRCMDRLDLGLAGPSQMVSEPKFDWLT